VGEYLILPAEPVRIHVLVPAYSINTESNYMNYTTCFTLFTAGQKADACVCCSSDRISLTTYWVATATDAGAIQCIPKINFEIDNDQRT